MGFDCRPARQLLGPVACAEAFRCRGIVDRVERSPDQADAMNEALFEMLQHCVAEMTPPGSALPR